jgi:hypothetical protein
MNVQNFWKRKIVDVDVDVVDDDDDNIAGKKDDILYPITTSLAHRV